jgi:predicted permease
VLAELLSIVAPIYIAIGLGYGWARLGRRWDTELITDLIMTIGAPCLVFSSLVGLDVAPAAMLEMAFATFAAFATFGLVGALLLRVFRLPLDTFLAPIVFPNAGNMGLPVCLFAFGEEGLALGISFYAVAALTQFTVGLWLWSGQVSGRQLFATPLTWAVAIAVVVMAVDVPVPSFALRATELVGGFTIPLMQLSLGVSLASFGSGTAPRTVALALLRLGMGLAVGAGLAALFGLEGAARGVLILDCSMPVAVLNYLLAQRYQKSPSEVASLVVVSTVLSLVTLPLILAWVL